jgi:hypothetical protein
LQSNGRCIELKKYYRLSELSNTRGFSDADIDYLNAETDVSFCLYSKTTDVILGGWRNKKFSAFGKAKYVGLISMTQNQQTEMFEKSKVSITQSKILQKDKIAQYSSDYPFSVEIPNTVINEWLSTPFESIPFEIISFYFYPDERKSMIKEFCKMIDDMAEVNDKVGIEKRIRKYPRPYDPSKPINTELFYNHQRFTLSDVCITSDELEKAKSYLCDDSDDSNVLNHKVVDKKSIDKVKPSTQVLSTTHEREADFNSLVIKIVSTNLTISAKETWAILENEIKTMPNERKYDQYNILCNQVADEIFWQSRYGNSGSQKFGSINTTVSRAKKKVNIV